MSTAERLRIVREATVGLLGALDGLDPVGEGELAAVRAALSDLGEVCSWYGGPGTGGVAGSVLAALAAALVEGGGRG